MADVSAQKVDDSETVPIGATPAGALPPPSSPDGVHNASNAAPASLREDQIQNAVAFLSHPKVRGSPTASKRDFLEKKGLTAAEIDEAMRRVPDAPSASVPAQPALAPGKPYPTGTPQVALGQLQPQPIIQQPQAQPIRWTQVVVGMGLVAAVGYAVRQYALPKALAWYKEWRCDSEKAAAEEQQRKTAELVASALQAQTAEVQKTLEGLKDAIKALEEGKEAGAAAPAPKEAITLSDLRSELRVLASSLNEFGSPAKGSAGDEELGKLDEIKDLLAKVADQVSTQPPPPQQLPSSFIDHHAGVTQWLGQPAADGVQDMHPASLNGPAPLPPPPHPTSYMEVLEMLEKGQTPPGIRTDIDDEPPNPSAPPPGARMQPRPKPWERADGGISPAQGSSPLAGGSSHPTASTFSQASQGHITTEALANGNSILAGSSTPAAPVIAPADAWKPPAVPQPSLPRHPPAARASLSSGEGSEVDTAARSAASGPAASSSGPVPGSSAAGSSSPAPGGSAPVAQEPVAASEVEDAAEDGALGASGSGRRPE